MSKTVASPPPPSSPSLTMLTEMIATTAATIEQRWEQGTRTHLFSSAVEIAVAAEGRLDDAAMKSSFTFLTKVGWAGGRGKP